jgi:VanZ family protein
MRKVIRSTWFWVVAAVAVLIVIAVLSSQNSEQSNSVTLRIANAVYLVLTQWLAGSDEEMAVLAINNFIRKLAHFSIFGVFAALLCSVCSGVRKLKTVRYELTLLLVIVAALSDELHQHFTGRSASLTDVLIDVSGAIFVLLIIRIISLKKAKNESNERWL